MSDNICDNGLDEGQETLNVGDEYQEAEGDCVEEEYYVDQEDDDVANSGEEYEDQYDRHADESVELHDGDHADIVFSSEQDEPNTTDDVVDEGDIKVAQDTEKEEEGGTTEQDIETDKKEVEVECTMTEEEKLEQYKILDGYQRQIDEEMYTLRKLRSIIGNLSDDIERIRKKIASYTKEAEDQKACEGMEKLKAVKADRERAVEERHISTDALADVKALRTGLVEALKKEKGLVINPKLTYLIEDKELQALFKTIRAILKHNSFGTLKLTLPELDDVIDSVEKLCDDIDSFLISKTVKPRDLNKLNTKERRVTVLYDKLLKWRCYKVEDPDIRPTDYESFMYDPEDMFNDDKGHREGKSDKPKREMRAVRGGSSDKSPDKRPRSPIRPPSPTATPSASARPARRAVRGGTPEGEEKAPVKETQIRKRKAGTTSGEHSYKRSKRPIRRSSPIRRDRQSPGKLERSKYSPVAEGRRSGPGGRYSDMNLPARPSTASRSRPTLLRTPPQRANTSLHRARSPSPVYRPRKENFQISVRNETYRSRSPVQERSYRADRSPPPVAVRHNYNSRPMRGGRGRGYFLNNSARRDTYRR